MRRHRTHDREATPIFITERIGPKRARTPEGYLLCLDVPISRVGTMLYHEEELPMLKGNADGVIRVERTAETLFRPETIASFNGKSVVDDHPDDDVAPGNWKELTIGVCLNPRRGEGEDHDVLLADLLITDHRAIRDVEAGKREVSAGYEAEYEQTGDGSARQFDIIGNHIALVDRGRCGPRCAIGDHQPNLNKEHAMPIKTKRRVRVIDDAVRARVRQTFKDAEEEAIAALAAGVDPEGDGVDPDEEGGESHTHIHIHQGGSAGEGGEGAAGGEGGGTETKDDVGARLDALEAGHKDLGAKLDQILSKLGGTGDASGEGGEGEGSGEEEEVKATDGMPEEVEAAMKAKTGDSAALQTCFKAVVADAEVLVPGFRLPTYDSKASRKKTLDSICQFRRGVLGHVAMTADGADFLATVNGGSAPALDKMSCAAAAALFRSAAAARRALNNRSATGDSGALPNKPGSKDRPTVRSIADLNAMNRKYHEGRSA